MLFNSIEFACFLPLVFVLYWYVFARNLNAANLFLVAASYLFYGWWDWRFLSLIAFSSLADFGLGWAIEHQPTRARKKAFLGASLAINLGILGFFKYYGFFVASAAELLHSLGFDVHLVTLQVVLPVGVSFYTFQALSYTIDVYRGHLRATRNPITFLAFVSFFPQLVAGPIERAVHLIPQFQHPRTFDPGLARDGMRQMLWGLFKKVVVADTCALAVEPIFGAWQEQGALALLAGAVFFAFQIYCDFSGYSDIAVGCARLFGFDLMRNFAVPYFSRDIAEFWRRWHISLSTWFRDYVYLPLGGSRLGRWGQLRNVMITFAVSGFWHGANWTFLAWGVLNGLFYVPLLLAGRQGAHGGTVAEGRRLPRARELGQMAATFGMVLVGWVFFRSASITDAAGYLHRMATAGGSGLLPQHALAAGVVAALLLVEWPQRVAPHGLSIGHWPGWARWLAYLVLSFLVIVFFRRDQSFIYFQF